MLAVSNCNVILELCFVSGGLSLRNAVRVSSSKSGLQAFNSSLILSMCVVYLLVCFSDAVVLNLEYLVVCIVCGESMVSSVRFSAEIGNTDSFV